MDIISHAVAGAATGAIFGRPLLGAMVAALPDAVLGLRRRLRPSALYNATHSLLAVAVAASVGLILTSDLSVYLTILFAWISHLVLDCPTHGHRWAPTLFWPVETRFSLGEEWEFFNASWWKGLFITIIWSDLCLLIVMQQ